MRPKSKIYTPKRDDEHPHPFHMRSPPPRYSALKAVLNNTTRSPGSPFTTYLQMVLCNKLAMTIRQYMFSGFHHNRRTVFRFAFKIPGKSLCYMFPKSARLFNEPFLNCCWAFQVREKHLKRIKAWWVHQKRKRQQFKKKTDRFAVLQWFGIK